MRDDVKMCVNARFDMFEKYYIVPQNIAYQVESFCKEVTDLAEGCNDVADFEAKFISTGLSQKFNDLLISCTPKPYQISQEEQAFVNQTKKEMFEEDKEEIKKYIVDDVADSVKMEFESDIISAGRKVMIESGTLDEYTRITNVVEDVGIVAKGLGKLFGKKKK